MCSSEVLYWILTGDLGCSLKSAMACDRRSTKQRSQNIEGPAAGVFPRISDSPCFDVRPQCRRSCGKGLSKITAVSLRTADMIVVWWMSSLPGRIWGYWCPGPEFLVVQLVPLFPCGLSFAFCHHAGVSSPWCLGQPPQFAVYRSIHHWSR